MDTGRFGVENTVSIATGFSPFKSESSRLTIELVVLLFAFSIVVSKSVVLLPLMLSLFIRSCEQNEVFDPLSRKAYVSTVLSLPIALTLTGTIAKPTAVPSDANLLLEPFVNLT